MKVEPPISAAEREQILAAVKTEDQNKTVEEVLQPVASQAEQAQVVAELKKLHHKALKLSILMMAKLS